LPAQQVNLFGVTGHKRCIDATQPDADSEWGRLLGDKTMKIRIAIIAACAGTFALAQSNLAQATHAVVPESKSAVNITEFGSAPRIKLAAQNERLRKSERLRIEGHLGHTTKAGWNQNGQYRTKTEENGER
jgi:hypothetical protein